VEPGGCQPCRVSHCPKVTPRIDFLQPLVLYWCHAPVLRGLVLWMPIRLVGRAWTSDDGLQHGSGFDPLRHLHADGYASACWHRQLPACGAVVSDLLSHHACGHLERPDPTCMYRNGRSPDVISVRASSCVLDLSMVGYSMGSRSPGRRPYRPGTYEFLTSFG